ncbi:butyrophilin subfamily 1 member A1 isoform X1 [Salmo trutta]|uniref:Butyrophilin subfamily 1 member A1-like n=1 Tax=Salmo trutta TaxID=8032 RepID=A0A673VLS8_SALTR|nr:butyrophilin subfamily 1 member A1-like isoform X1 [Salmo trutta]
MGPLIQQVCLVTFLIFFPCSSAPVADGTETERQSTSESTSTLYGLDSKVWFAVFVTFGIIIFLGVVFLVWYKCCRDASRNLLGVFHVVGREEARSHEDTNISPHPKTPKTVSEKETNTNLDLPHNEARSHEVDVVLDGKTAHSQLKISHNGKVVEWVTQKGEPQTEIDKNDIDKHFDEDPYVLGSMVRAMRAYWEVYVKENKDWVLGVTRATASRKGQLVLSPDNGFWVVRISNGENLKTFMGDDVLKERIPHRVGIYVDYQEKKVTFYNAEDSSLIYSFTNGPSYEDDARPLFSPWKYEKQPITILSIETKNVK